MFNLKLKKLGNDSRIYMMKDYMHAANILNYNVLGIQEIQNGVAL